MVQSGGLCCPLFDRVAIAYGTQSAGDALWILTYINKATPQTDKFLRLSTLQLEA